MDLEMVCTVSRAQLPLGCRCKPSCGACLHQRGEQQSGLHTEVSKLLELATDTKLRLQVGIESLLSL
jgi:hypothetical protein